MQPHAGARRGVGDYVLVHAGYAITVLDETEAQETLDLLREIGALDEADAGEAADADDARDGDAAAGADVGA